MARELTHSRPPINPYDAIRGLLDEHSVQYRTVEHEPVYTSAQAAEVRGTKLECGAKSLLIKAKENFALAVIPGDRRLDTKKLKAILGVKDLRFATPDEVREKMGCEVGACYPFGGLCGVRMVVDYNLSHIDEITFNPGSHTVTIIMAAADYMQLVHPEFVDIIGSNS